MPASGRSSIHHAGERSPPHTDSAIDARRLSSRFKAGTIPIMLYGCKWRRMPSLARSRDPSDERQVRITLTKKGKSLQQKARDYPSYVDGATGLSDDALGKLRAHILSVRTALLKADV